MSHVCIAGSGVQLIEVTLLRSLLSSYGIQLIAGSQKFTSEVHFLRVLTRALLLALTKSICHTMVVVVLTLVANLKPLKGNNAFRFENLPGASAITQCPLGTGSHSSLWKNCMKE